MRKKNDEKNSGWEENRRRLYQKDKIYEIYQEGKIDAVVKRRRLRYPRQIETMTDDRTVKKIAWKPWMTRGRPRKHEKGVVMSDLKARNSKLMGGS